MLLIELLKAMLFGVVEGITEWLPISSTGHLILLEEFISFARSNQAFLELFNVVIQLGAILAVILIYSKTLNPFQKSQSAEKIKEVWHLWGKVALACVPVVVVGLPLDDWFEAHFHHFLPVALMLIIYGLAFIWVENYRKGHRASVVALDQLTYTTALGIGLFQVLSLMPGTSRSGATIIGGLLMGTSRQVVTEFTFFLGIPIMFGASLLKVVKFFYEGNSLDFQQILILLMAMLTAFVISMFVIRFLTNFVKKHDFKIFGYYRIALGILLLIYAGVKSFL